METQQVKYLSEDDIKLIVTKYGYSTDDIQCYKVKKASENKMLGFLSEYLKLNITVKAKNELKQLHLFIKAISRTNESKAKFLKEANYFNTEIKYYELINGVMKVPELKPWTARCLMAFEDVIVFEDLYALKYKMRNKQEKLDMNHIKLALNALARFHACTIIYEEKRSKELQRPYRVNEDYIQYFPRGVYCQFDDWFYQRRERSLEAVKVMSKYSKDADALNIIERRWRDVWNSSLDLAEATPEQRAVICHRDLWNNNLLFHYKQTSDNDVEPDDCLLVDFQTLHCQPPAADIMMLLHCNLDARFRKENLDALLDYYYDELKTNLSIYDINIGDIITKEELVASAKVQNLWGLMTSASLMPIVWPEDCLIYETFNDSEKFKNVMVSSKGNFIIDMMKMCEGYKEFIIGIFEEIVDDYILNQKA